MTTSPQIKSTATTAQTTHTPQTTSTENLVLKKFNDIMGQWYLVATTYAIRDTQVRNCQTATFFRHDNDYYMKTSENQGNQTYTVVDNKIVIDPNSNTFSTNNKKYSYSIFSKPLLINHNEKMLYLQNLANATETYLYTEYNFINTNAEYRIDLVIQKYYGQLSPIYLMCYTD
jgi:hypothetical protein